jgi:hypothetical protein
MAKDTSILLPVQNGTVNQCRAEGLKYVHIQLALDFADLNMIRPAPTTILKGKYYIKLPQRTILLTNNNGVAYNLATSNGAADLQTLSPSEVQQDILNETYQDGLFNLLEPAVKYPYIQPGYKIHIKHPSYLLLGITKHLLMIAH